MSEKPDPPKKPSEWDEDRMWSELRARTIDAKLSPANRVILADTPLTPQSRTEPRGARSYAAAALFLVSAAASILLFVNRRGLLDSGASQAGEAGHYSTSRGQYATIQLTDGSQVTLAPLSNLTIAATFYEGTREIRLDGEAIFTVKHDASHPFRVRANRALIEDIGTRFDLRAYRDEARVSVAVLEGSVSLTRSSAGLSGGAKSVVVHDGEIGVLDKSGDATAARSTRVASMLDWAHGRLSFSNQPLPEVLRTIGRWYDLDVHVTDTRLSARLVTADFSTQSPSEMIDALAIALDATVQRSGRVYTLSPR